MIVAAARVKAGRSGPVTRPAAGSQGPEPSLAGLLHRTCAPGRRTTLDSQIEHRAQAEGCERADGSGPVRGRAPRLVVRQSPAVRIGPAAAGAAPRAGPWVRGTEARQERPGRTRG